MSFGKNLPPLQGYESGNGLTGKHGRLYRLYVKRSPKAAKPLRQHWCGGFYVQFAQK